MSGIPRLYTPGEIGESLGRSAWWVKEQCRRGRFPSVKAAGAYRFTDEHVAEILRILEHRPGQGQQQRQGGTTGHRAKPQTTPGLGLQLRARRPRRARDAG